VVIEEGAHVRVHYWLSAIFVSDHTMVKNQIYISLDDAYAMLKLLDISFDGVQAML
jgi:hypothetical protein